MCAWCKVLVALNENMSEKVASGLYYIDLLYVSRQMDWDHRTKMRAMRQQAQTADWSVRNLFIH